jgi:hypothetical protein
MQLAAPSLPCHRAQTGSSYPLAGKCVNHFVLRVLINTNRAEVGKDSCGTGFGLWIFRYELAEKSKTTG